MNKIILPVITFVSAALIGWAIRSSETVAQSDKNTESGSRSRTLSYRDAQRDLSAIYGASSSDERIYSTFKLVDSIPISNFEQWMDEGWFDSREGFELTLFQRLLEERWQREDPDGFVMWCLKEGAKSSKISSGTSSDAALPVLRDWALNDPERIQKLFAENPNQMLEGQLISGLAKSSPEIAVKLLGIFAKNNTTGNSYYYYQAIRDLSSSAPERLETSLSDLPKDLRMMARTHISQERLKKDFDGEFSRLLKDPQGLLMIGGSSSLSKENIAKVVGKLEQFPEAWKTNLKQGGLSGLLYGEGGEAWLNADLEGAGFSFEEASNVRMYSAMGLANRDTEATIKQVENFDLTEKNRKTLVENIFQNLVFREPDKVESYLSSLDSEKDAEIARTAIEVTRKRLEERKARAAKESE